MRKFKKMLVREIHKNKYKVYGHLLFSMNVNLSSKILGSDKASFCCRNPCETVVAAKACEAPEPLPRTEWDLSKGGVKGIVSSLEEGLNPSTSQYTTAVNASLPMDIPDPSVQPRNPSEAEFQPKPKLYQTPAEKVSDLLRRPTPSHNPKKYDIPLRLRRSQECLNTVVQSRGRNRYLLYSAVQSSTLIFFT